MRTKGIYFISLLLPFALMFMYVWMTATEMPFRDDIYLIEGGPIGKYLQGTLSFSDLWRPSDGQRLLGYNLIMLANAKWFFLNGKIIALMIPFFSMAAALLIYHEFRKSLSPARSPEFIAAAFFILSFIVFNVIQWEGLLFGYSLVYQIATPFFIAAFLSLELFLEKGGRRNRMTALIITALAVLVFSGRLSIVFVPALGVTFICYVLIRRDALDKAFLFRVFEIVFFLAVIALIYAYKIQYNDYVADPVFYAAEIFAEPLAAAKFLSASLASSVVGVDVFAAFNYLSFRMMIFFGLTLLFFYILALIIFFKSGMYQKTYLPLFLIMFTLFYLVFMMFRRFGLGIDYGMASRYTCVSIFGLAAIVWIFVYGLTRGQKLSALIKFGIFAGFGFILAGLFLTSIIAWQNQPQRKAHFSRLEAVAMRVDTANEKDLSIIGEWPEQVRTALILLRDHRLNVYRLTANGGASLF